MAHDGRVPVDLGIVGANDTKKTQSDSDTSNDMSYEDVCAIAWKGYKGPSELEVWHRGKGADEWTSGTGDDGSKKGGKKGSKPGTGNKGKSATRYCYDCGV